MKKIILAILLFIHASVTVYAVEIVPSDADICSGLLSEAVEKILSCNSAITGTIVRLTNYRGTGLSSMARKKVESIITQRGFTLTDTTYEADTIIEISVTDVSIVLQKQQGQYKRTVSLSVHLTCQDRTGLVFFASGRRETAGDSIPDKKTARSTDNSHLFGRGVLRAVIAHNNLKLMSATLLVIVGALTYYSAQ